MVSDEDAKKAYKKELRRIRKIYKDGEDDKPSKDYPIVKKVYTK